MAAYPLPPSSRLNISALSGLYRNTTNSYKYLFFLSLLSCLKAENFLVHNILLATILESMLVRAWYSSSRHHLSFGIQDRVSEILSEIHAEPPANHDLLVSWTRSAIDRGIGEKLLRYVPTRLIRPFFDPSILRGTADHEIDRLVERYSRERFETDKPLYLIGDDRTSITVHPEWMAYMRDNYTIILSWTLWEWLLFLQTRNPNVPNMAGKLGERSERGNLTAERKYWQTVIDASREGAIRCIYTNVSIKGDNFHLDHFVPRSFVGHDQTWNLVPVIAEANEAKSDSIPDRSYMDRLIHLQYVCLRTSHSIMSTQKWEQATADYVQALRIGYNDLLREKTLTQAYASMLTPLLSIAASTGFPANWRWLGEV